jgi:putative SOS response-associated peptidase YedK
VPKLAARFGAAEPASPAPNYNAAPSQALPIITNAAPQQIQLVPWGLKPSFRQLLARRRCLVLADSFYEWQATERGKIPHRILLQKEEPFAFAGLWDEWVDRASGEVHPTFTIITTEPNALMASIHNRMPVILPGPEAERAWLADDLGPTAHQQLLVPYDAALMKEYAVTTRVNSPAHNDPEVLAAA